MTRLLLAFGLLLVGVATANAQYAPRGGFGTLGSTPGVYNGVLSSGFLTPSAYPRPPIYNGVQSRPYTPFPRGTAFSQNGIITMPQTYPTFSRGGLTYNSYFGGFSGHRSFGGRRFR